jgi:PhnB protein
MAAVSTYLNFARETEQAFAFYRSVFRTEYAGPIVRFSEIPASEGAPPVAEADRNLVMHVALPLLNGHMLMGTDAPESMGFKVTAGNNTYIMLQPDTRKEADRLFKALAEGGKVEMPMADMFWGDYFGSLRDRFGVQWMVSVSKSGG